jgi:hypothetical protein
VAGVDDAGDGTGNEDEEVQPENTTADITRIMTTGILIVSMNIFVRVKIMNLLNIAGLRIRQRE